MMNEMRRIAYSRDIKASLAKLQMTMPDFLKDCISLGESDK